MSAYERRAWERLAAQVAERADRKAKVPAKLSQIADRAGDKARDAWDKVPVSDNLEEALLKALEGLKDLTLDPAMASVSEKAVLRRFGKHGHTVGSVNSGLVLSGSSFTFERAWDGVLGRDSSDAMDAMDMTEGNMDMDKGGMPAANGSAVTVDPAGIQHIRIEVRSGSYSRARVRARAGLPTMLILATKGLRACTNGFVIPSANLERTLPETGETVIDLGKPAAGRIECICSAGMYGGVIEVS